jgi:hypothetical protein
VKTETTYTRCNLLSIDADRTYEGGWNWNAWYNIEKDIYFAESELTARKILSLLRKWGFLTEQSKGRLSIDDDGYNIVIQDKNTFEPLLALCYGECEQ